MKTKKWLLCFILLALLGALVGCGQTVGGGGGGGGGGGVSGGGGVTFKGSFTGGMHASLFDKMFAWFISPAYALVTSDIKYVVVIGGSNFSSYPAPVAVDADGNFSLSGIPSDKPCGLVFLGSTHEFKGYYLLPNGMSSLPVNAAAVGTLDLGTLNSNGLIVTSNVVFSNLFNLDADQEGMLKDLEGGFSTTIKDPDKDNNGTVDFCESKYWGLNMMLWMGRAGEGGNVYGSSIFFVTTNPTEYTPTLTFPVPLTGHKLIFVARDTGVSGVTTVNFDRPFRAAINGGCEENGDTYAENGSKIFFSTFVSGSATEPVVPDAGTYTIKYDNGGSGTLGTSGVSFNLPARTQQALVVIKPTVHLNANGTVKSISVEFRKNDGSGTAIAPLPIFKTYNIRIYGLNLLYSAEMLPVTTTSHTLTNTGIDWAHVNSVFLSYNDVYQNHFFTAIDNPNFVP
jgi:hypothetical protein